jgi:hypothetical protein
MPKLNAEVSWSMADKRRALKMAKDEYGTAAYLDNTDVCLGASTVARWYTDPQGGLVLVDKAQFAEVEQ